MALGAAIAVGGLSSWVNLVGAAPTGKAPQLPAQVNGRAARARPGTRREELLSGLRPHARELIDGKYTSRLPRGQRAVLTVDPELDSFVSKLLKRNELPYAGVVAMVPSTGRLLAYVSHSSAEPNGPDRALEATAPAASVFKVITTTALLNEGLAPTRSTCYHGGSQALTMAELADNPKLDRACASITGALGFSINAVMGKLALKYLDPKKLTKQASLYGFGEKLPFDVQTERSLLDVPTEKLEFARTAAGFWHTSLSPLHGAAIAASIANKGKMMRPELVDSVVDDGGQVVFKAEPELFRKVMEPHIASQLGTMMTATIKQGTCRRSFRDARGRPLLPNIEVAGKTGTLNRETPQFRGYTWWVGFAPVDDPKIALAVLVVNSPMWRIKASQVAAETLKHYLVDMPKTNRVAKR
ncbi:MAG TPA: penicillin-binding transpeptidase domain-containing protein [Polyangiales bacterium]